MRKDRQSARCPVAVFTAAVLALLTWMPAGAQTPGTVPPVRYGQLHVKGSRLLDGQGNPVQLKGMSTMGLQWYGGIVNEAAFTALVKDWECDVIRLALYVGENGYATRPELKNLVKKGVELSLRLGVYVIIDWHVLTPGNPNDPVYRDAEAFFREMSALYGKYPNVIYEIMNEPNGPLSWQKDLKPYAQKMVSVIRSNDPDNLILIGSGTWSQDVDVAAADPVQGTNLMYTVHFYSGTHGGKLREKIQAALDRSVAVFCSEWGTSEASGTGGPYINASEEWLSFLDGKKISWVNWSLANKNEVSAAFRGLSQEYVEGKGNVVTQEETPLVPDRMDQGGFRVWDVSQLSVSGAYVRAKIKGDPLPSYTGTLSGWDFENGLSGWTVAEDSGAKPALTVGTAESKALSFTMKWASPGGADAWATAPRLKIADTGLELGEATALSFDVYLQEGKTVGKAFEINPVLQYPPSWWTQLPAVRLDYAAGKPAGNGLLKYSLSVPVSLSPGVKLSHLLFVVAGEGTGYNGTILFDNIAFTGTSNGDASRKPAGPVEDPGSFAGLPWDFEDGTRQGWTVAGDSPAKVRLGVGVPESKALMFTYGWTNPGPSDPWNAAPRITSSFVELKGADYSTLSLDFYIEAGKAGTGSLQVQPVLQSPQHGYWFQLNPVTIRYEAGKPVGNLLKYSLSVPLVSSTGGALKPDAVIRNLVLITIGLATDYQGAVFYDAINLK